MLNKDITAILSPLSARDRDVLVGRYGLIGSEPATLAQIGITYDITRERVRQIEALALASSRKRLAAGEGKEFVSAALAELKRRGGVSRDDRLVEALAKRQANGEGAAQFAAAARFLLELSGRAQLRREDEARHAYWYLSPADERRSHALVAKLVATLRKEREAILTNGKTVAAYLGPLAKAMRVSPAVAEEYVHASKLFSHSPFGTFGLNEWPQINPKTARDWAYLIARKEKKPLHFTELVSRINQYRTSKITNVQTVHNELIKDARFVLVGRGTYGLREHGYLAGTAREVLAHFLKKHGPLPSRELVKMVLQERIFKEGTLHINLQNRDHFKRLPDGRYGLREA